MKCSEYRQIASARIDGQVTAEESRLLDAHLEGCPACLRAERSMRALHSGLSGPAPAVSPDFRAALFARLDREALLPQRKGLLPRFPVWRWAVVPMAAAAGVALFLLVGRQAVEVGPGMQTARTGSPPAASSPDSSSVAGSPEAVPPPSAPASPNALPLAAARPPAAPGAHALTPEEAEIVAHLDLLEQAESLDDSAEGFDELFAPASKGKG